MLNHKATQKFNVKCFYDLKERLSSVDKKNHPLGTELNPFLIDKRSYIILKKNKMLDKDCFKYCIIQSFYYSKNGFAGYPNK